MRKISAQNHLYISDLDGTLLNREGILSPYSQKKLLSMLNEGLFFTVATARSLVSIQILLKSLPISLPVIHFNGAMISDMQSGQHQFVLGFKDGLDEDVAQFCHEKMGHRPFVSSFDGTDDHLSYEAIPNPGYRWYVEERKRFGDPRLRPVSAVMPVVSGEQVICYTVVADFESLNCFRLSLESHFPQQLRIRFFQNPYDTDWYWITIQPYEATKATAITRLLKEKGVSAQHLTVFGDHLNDQEMFQIAGRAVAVANAIEELARLATHRIGHHGDDCVVRFIEKDWPSQGS